MSDYIENQEYSMQLAAPGDDPFAYDWARLQEEVDGAASSLFGDITLASLQEPMDVDNVDLSGLHHALENGPWRDLFDWSPKDQGMDAQPDDRERKENNSNMDIDGNIQSSGTPASVYLRLPCDYPKCCKTYLRKGDLTRHKKKHESNREFVCTAHDCKFSFTRKDKLLDHIRAGHDSEALFSCLRRDCSLLLTKDILPLHRNLGGLAAYRQCPLPKCSFRVRSSISKMDEMQKHLLKGHNSKGRKQYASLLASRGYDSESGQPMCPICPDVSTFDKHESFGFHFLAEHCPDCVVENSWSIESEIFRHQWGHVTDQQYKHRRTILSLFPGFEKHPVWDDVQSFLCRGI